MRITSNTNITRFILILFSIFIVIAYIRKNTYNLVQGPVLNIEEPKDGTSYREPLINILGTVKNSAFISINGRQVFVDEENRINDKLLLLPGYNIIEIKTEDRFGKKSQKNIDVIYLN